MWPPKLAAKATRLLLDYQDIFSLEPHEIGCTDVTEHDIELLDHEPFKERFRRIAPPLVEEVRQHIQEMLDRGAIRPSQSPWCNAVVLVRKKDGSLRFCIDFQHLNAKTKKDSYPLPRMQETMESMVGTLYFSCMDLKSSFWQVKMSEKARQYTAFTVGSMGMYEFLRMPYGLCNAPATFQRLMQNCLGELNLTYALIYFDNVIVYSRTEEEHLTRLRAVFERFRESGLKLKPSKCNFFRTEINYLGHTVSAKGMEPGVDSIKAIAEMALPRTYTGFRQFLGATGYFRRFIKGYANIAKPLNDLLSGANSKLKSCFVRLPAGSGCSIPRAETQVYDSTSARFHRLPQALPARDRCLRRWPGRCPVTKAGGWTLSPGHLHQPRLERRRTEIPFIQVRVPRPQVGDNRAISRISTIPAVLHKD